MEVVRHPRNVQFMEAIMSETEVESSPPRRIILYLQDVTYYSMSEGQWIARFPQLDIAATGTLPHLVEMDRVAMLKDLIRRRRRVQTLLPLLKERGVIWRWEDELDQIAEATAQRLKYTKYIV